MAPLVKFCRPKVAPLVENCRPTKVAPLVENRRPKVQKTSTKGATFGPKFSIKGPDLGVLHLVGATFGRDLWSVWTPTDGNGRS